MRVLLLPFTAAMLLACSPSQSDVKTPESSQAATSKQDAPKYDIKRQYAKFAEVPISVLATILRPLTCKIGLLLAN